MFLQSSCRRLATLRPYTMPLRAKITSPSFSGNATRQFASAIRELPEDTPDDVLFDSQYGLRTIKLNRPKKLNSLDGSMCRKIVPRLLEWSKSDMANVVVLKGEGRALCAGGDVAWLALRNKEGESQKSKDFFALEYQLDHLIATYNKPYISFMDGITMGGGVGLSLHAPFRIATENTVFAMPETTIGFFPDVGASFFLPRLDGQLGMYFALTSEQLKGVGNFYAGVATHYLHSSSLPDLEARLGELNFRDYTTPKERLVVINNTIEEFATGIPHDFDVSKSVVGGLIRQAIDYVFQRGNDIDGMLKALAEYEENKEGKIPEVVVEWSAKTRKTILQRSPTSVKVTVQQLRAGAKWRIGETFRKEHSMASVFMEHPDFVEGVSALLIDKPKRSPEWKPQTIDDVTDQEVSSFFTPEPTLELLNDKADANYDSYPHAWLGLPKESEIRDEVLRGQHKSGVEVVNHFVEKLNGKQGVQQKVEEVVQRKTTDEGGSLTWE